MKITIVTLFPEMIRGFIDESIVKRAREKGAVEIEIVNLRDFALDSYGTVDDRPFGGGAGMVLMAEPLVQALKKAKKGFKKGSSQKVVLTSARGTSYKQEKAREYAKLDNLIIIAGHYEAVDERISPYIDEEISVGDYVLTGGELPAAIILDSVVRLLPDVLKKKDATEIESFFEVTVDELEEVVKNDPLILKLQENGVKKVQLLEYPHFTRPQEYEGQSVPEVLLSGDPKKIRVWQLLEAYKKTKEVRPDLLQQSSD